MARSALNFRSAVAPKLLQLEAIGLVAPLQMSDALRFGALFAL